MATRGWNQKAGQDAGEAGGGDARLQAENRSIGWFADEGRERAMGLREGGKQSKEEEEQQKQKQVSGGQLHPRFHRWVRLLHVHGRW